MRLSVSDCQLQEAHQQVPIAIPARCTSHRVQFQRNRWLQGRLYELAIERRSCFRSPCPNLVQAREALPLLPRHCPALLFDCTHATWIHFASSCLKSLVTPFLCRTHGFLVSLKANLTACDWTDSLHFWWLLIEDNQTPSQKRHPRRKLLSTNAQNHKQFDAGS